ncbi:hypothetical protein Bca4012_050472 [Brassica carinata]
MRLGTNNQSKPVSPGYSQEKESTPSWKDQVRKRSSTPPIAEALAMRLALIKAATPKIFFLIRMSSDNHKSN